MQGRDFLFEEATGLGPTTAEVRCNEPLGPAHYLDVDPAVEHRAAYEITENTGEPCYVRPCDPDGFTYNSELIKPQGVRENLWLHRIREKEFENGLLVCGFLHTLSMSFKLLRAG